MIIVDVWFSMRREPISDVGHITEVHMERKGKASGKAAKQVGKYRLGMSALIGEKEKALNIEDWTIWERRRGQKISFLLAIRLM